MTELQTTQIPKQENQTPKILYHYTQQTGFLDIIRTKKIWATDGFYLNDSAEMKHAWTIAKEVLTKPGIAKYPDEEKIIENIISFADYPFNMRVFVASFSGARNQLSQWRAYGAESCGFSIGFDLNELQELNVEPEPNLQRCIYQRDQQEILVRKAIEQTFEKYASDLQEAKAVADDKIKIEIRRNATFAFLANFVRFVPKLKDPSFSAEDEYRLIYRYGELKRKVLFRKGRSTIVPYVELDLPQNNGILSVKEILVGPTPNPELAVHAAQQLMIEEKMNPEIVRYCEIPYRSMGI